MTGTLAEGREPMHVSGAIAGALLGPLASLLDVGISFLLVPHACARGGLGLLLGIDLAALGLTFAGAALCWRAAGDRESTPASRWQRFSVQTGLGLNGLAALLILALALPKLWIDPCAA